MITYKPMQLQMQNLIWCHVINVIKILYKIQFLYMCEHLKLNTARTQNFEVMFHKSNTVLETCTGEKCAQRWISMLDNRMLQIYWSLYTDGNTWMKAPVPEDTMNNGWCTLHKVCLVLGLTRQEVGRHHITELCDGAEGEATPRGYSALQALVCHQTKSDTMPAPQGWEKWTSSNHHRTGVVQECEIRPAQIRCSFQTTQSWWYNWTNIHLKWGEKKKKEKKSVSNSCGC